MTTDRTERETGGTHGQAPARAGLVGNPSDGYFGRTISVVVPAFHAEATCQEASTLVLAPPAATPTEFADVDDLLRSVAGRGHAGNTRLLTATIKRFVEHCRARGLRLGHDRFSLAFGTDIPVRVGLAGSSAIVVAVLRALMRFHGVTIEETRLPGLALAVEVEELGIPAGLQDRVVQVYGGVVSMDFDRVHQERHGHGRYERLDPALLPPLFVAYDERLGAGTETVHGELRRRWERGDHAVGEAMTRLANLARDARDLLVAGRGAEIGPLVDANFDLRAAICVIDPGHRRLVDTGRDVGAAVKFAGSGGAVVGVYDGDPARLDRLREAYRRIGARLVTVSRSDGELHREGPRRATE